MAKVQGKKAAAAGKSAVKKVAMRVKNVAVAAKKKAASKKPPAPAKAAGNKKVPAKSAGKAVAKVKAVAKTVSKATKKVAKKAVAKVAPRTKPALKSIKAVKPATKSAPKAAPKPASKSAKPAPKPTVKPQKAAPKPAAKPAPVVAAKPVAKPAAKAAPAPAPKAAAKPAAPAKGVAKAPARAVPAAAGAAPVAAPLAKPAPEPEKKRGRRARPRIISSGAPAAAWLTSEKPRPASFIPAPARAEAPSAIAAPPASSDRLLRPDDVDHPAVRTVPVRIDVEQGAGRFYVIANPSEVTVRVGEGIEWDFRYIGGADVTADEIVIEFEKPSPFAQATFRTRKPGGARPHRQLSNGALPTAAGKRIEYTVRAMTMFKTEMASTKIWVNILP